MIYMFYLCSNHNLFSRYMYCQNGKYFNKTINLLLVVNTFKSLCPIYYSSIHLYICTCMLKLYKQTIRKPFYVNFIQENCRNANANQADMMKKIQQNPL